MDDIESCLKHEPGRETRDNKKEKKLRPNRLAERELRVDRFRVFYDIDEGAALIKIEARDTNAGTSCRFGARKSSYEDDCHLALR